MRRRSIWLAMLGVTVAFAVAVATAAAVSAPAGTPDLSLMTLQAGDLAPGATVATDDYATPPKNFTAAYDRNFAAAKTPAGLRLLALDTQVLLGESAAAATGLFARERGLLRSKRGRSLVTKVFESAPAQNGARITKVHFEKFRRLALGSDAFLQPVLLHVKHRHFAADFVVLRDGAVVSTVSLVLTDPTQALPVAVQLGTDVSDHITAVLAATGSTGSSGATGPTGTT